MRVGGGWWWYVTKHCYKLLLLLATTLLITIKLSRFDEFARENLGLGILGEAGALVQVEILHLFCLLAISYIPSQTFIHLLERTFRFLYKKKQL